MAVVVMTDVISKLHNLLVFIKIKRTAL